MSWRLTQKMRPKTSNEPFQEDLEHCSCDQAVEQANHTVVDIPE